jgi:NAD(P)-dependent dehydrogenase (short-subunit alcohol dehydrogenase family)
VRILIAGGTRGLGLALAEKYVAMGHQVIVCSRYPERLDTHPLAKNPRLVRRRVDVRDRDQTQAAIAELGYDGIDLLIVSAGHYADAAAIEADPGEAERILATNVHGLCHLFDAVLPIMRKQGRGQLVAIASIAGLLANYRYASLYSASKRAAISLCDVYRKALVGEGIGVTILIPGYVDTARLRELNGGSAASKPFLISEAGAVNRMVAAIEREDDVCIFPRRLYWLVRAFNALPDTLRSLRKK